MWNWERARRGRLPSSSFSERAAAERKEEEERGRKEESEAASERSDWTELIDAETVRLRNEPRVPDWRRERDIAGEEEEEQKVEEEMRLLGSSIQIQLFFINSRL